MCHFANDFLFGEGGNLINAYTIIELLINGGWILLSVAAVCAGFIFSWIIKTDYEKRLANQEWPIVTGTVTGQDTLAHPESNEYGPDRYHYHSILDIEYLVGDVRNSVRPEDNAHPYSTIAGALAAHTLGEDQQLYVNPANPVEAVLYFEQLPSDGWIGTSQVVMYFCVGLAVLFLVLGWVRTRTRTANT